MSLQSDRGGSMGGEALLSTGFRAGSRACSGANLSQRHLTEAGVRGGFAAFPPPTLQHNLWSEA